MTTALVLSVTAIFFALVLTLSNRYIANYGKVKVTINKQSPYVVDGGLTLVEALQESGITVPTTCGGRGTCGLCKVKVINGAEGLLAVEKATLGNDVLAEGYRLACQLKVTGDITVELPDATLAVDKYDCIVDKCLTVSGNTRLIRLLLPENNSFQFTPGQHIQFFAPVYPENDTEVIRNYSIASGSVDKRVIELMVRKNSEGKCSTYIHDYLREGDGVAISGPYGKFTYEEDDMPLLLIAVDAGIAALYAMLNHIEETGSRRKVTLLYFGTTEKDLFQEELFQPFDGLNVTITQKMTLSSEVNEFGIIDDEFEATFERLVQENESLEIYICGRKETAGELRKFILKQGVPVDRVHYQQI